MAVVNGRYIVTVSRVGARGLRGIQGPIGDVTPEALAAMQTAIDYATADFPPDPNDPNSESAKTAANRSSERADFAFTQAGISATKANDSASSSASSQAWAVGTEPGGPGTRSSREWAGIAEAFVEAGDNIYTTTAAGIAGTTPGQVFIVSGTGDQYSTMYENVGGVATFRATQVSMAYWQARFPEPTLPNRLLSFEDGVGAEFLYLTSAGVMHVGGGIDETSMGWEVVMKITGTARVWSLFEASGEEVAIAALFDTGQFKLYGQGGTPEFQIEDGEDGGGGTVVVSDPTAPFGFPTVQFITELLPPKFTGTVPPSLTGMVDAQGRGPNYAARFPYPYTPDSIQSWHGPHAVSTSLGHLYACSVETGQNNGFHKMRLITQFLYNVYSTGKVIRHGWDHPDDDHDKGVYVPILDPEDILGVDGVLIYGGHNGSADYLKLQYTRSEDCSSLSAPINLAGPRSTYAWACQHPTKMEHLYIFTRINTNGQWLLTVFNLATRGILWQAMCMDSVVPQLYFAINPQFDLFGMRFTCYPNPSQQTVYNYLVTAVLDWEGQWWVDDPATPGAYVQVANGNIREWAVLLDPLSFGRKVYRAPVGEVIRQCEGQEFRTAAGVVTCYMAKAINPHEPENSLQRATLFTVDVDWTQRMDSPYDEVSPGVPLRIPLVTVTTLTDDGGIGIQAPSTSNPSYWGGCSSGGHQNRALTCAYDTLELPGNYSIMSMYYRTAVGSPWVRQEVICVRDGRMARPQTVRLHYMTGGNQRSRPDTKVSVWIGETYGGFASNVGLSAVVAANF